jgi:hypothetical protein
MFEHTACSNSGTAWLWKFKPERHNCWESLGKTAMDLSIIHKPNRASLTTEDGTLSSLEQMEATLRWKTSFVCDVTLCNIPASQAAISSESGLNSVQCDGRRTDLSIRPCDQIPLRVPLTLPWIAEQGQIKNCALERRSYCTSTDDMTGFTLCRFKRQSLLPDKATRITRKDITLFFFLNSIMSCHCFPLSGRYV